MMLEVPVTLKRLSNILGYAGCNFLFLLTAEFFFFFFQVRAFEVLGCDPYTGIYDITTEHKAMNADRNLLH